MGVTSKVIKRFLLLLSIAIYGLQLNASNYKYRVYFNSKQGTHGSLSRPESFLTSRAIERRIKYGIAIDSTDLPVSRTMIQEVLSACSDSKLITTSKWNNTAVFSFSSKLQANDIARLPQVKKVELVWIAPGYSVAPSRKMAIEDVERADYSLLLNNGLVSSAAYADIDYGKAYAQISLHNGQLIHNSGFTGNDVHIAMIDGGYIDADKMSWLGTNKQCLTTYNFVNPQVSVYAVPIDHGTACLSTIVAKKTSEMVGTAPNVKYHLLVSEDDSCEALVEEDFFAAATEYADSVGVDLITCSLGYNNTMSVGEKIDTTMLNGKTMLSSITAEMAVKKGVFVCLSAGNEGDKQWRKITFPSDAQGVLSVGAINRTTNTITSFSSYGPTSDGRVKPEVVAVGGATALLRNASGIVSYANGTSFACPIIAGLVACLIEAYPKIHPMQLYELIIKHSNRHSSPMSNYGYGIPNFSKVFDEASVVASEPLQYSANGIQLSLLEKVLTIEGLKGDATIRLITQNSDTIGEWSVSDVPSWCVDLTGCFGLHILMITTKEKGLTAYKLMIR